MLKLSKKRKADLETELKLRELRLSKIKDDVIQRVEAKKLAKDICWIKMALQVWG